MNHIQPNFLPRPCEIAAADEFLAYCRNAGIAWPSAAMLKGWLNIKKPLMAAKISGIWTILCIRKTVAKDA